MGLRDRIKGALGLGAHTPLTEGQPAPEIGLADSDGTSWTLAGLAGRKVVIFFYPADDTPGCTKEACGFRTALQAAQPPDAVVLGVSTQGAASHKAFIQKYNLNFPLLVDAGGAMAERWGVKGGANARRVTFLLDGTGTIRRVWDPVSVDGHVDAVLAELARV